MDNTNLVILKHVQEKATQSFSNVALKVGLDTTRCWRRVQWTEELCIIRKDVVCLEAETKSVFVAVPTKQHNADWLRQFCTMVPAMSEVGEFYPMSGKVDYIFCLVVDDMVTHDAFFCKLITNDDITNVSSSVATEQIKFSTALPLTANNIDGGCHVR